MLIIISITAMKFIRNYSIFVLNTKLILKIMKSKKWNFILIAIVIVMSTIINSCKVADKLKMDPQSGKDFVTAESAFSNVFKTVSDAVQANNLTKDSKNGCPEIILNGTTFPMTVSIDFKSGCENGGVTYKGKIIAVMTDHFKTAGCKIDVTFDGFYVNDNKVEGTKTITNLGRNTDAVPKLMFKVEVKNGIITTPDGTIKFNATKTWTWLEGEDTAWPTINDDVWLLEGNASGTNVNNLNYTVSTISGFPLKIKILGCLGKTEIVSGKLKIVPEEGQDMTLNYGNGDCDKKAVITIAGVDFDVDL
jgi:hypothetical protein